MGEENRARERDKGGGGGCGWRGLGVLGDLGGG